MSLRRIWTKLEDLVLTKLPELPFQPRDLRNNQNPKKGKAREGAHGAGQRRPGPGHNDRARLRALLDLSDYAVAA